MTQAQAIEHDEHDDYEDDDAPPAPAVAEGGIDDAPPEGFESKGGDLVGYWQSASQGSAKTDAHSGSPPVLFTPLFVTLADSKIAPRKGEQAKSSTLLHCRLERPCQLRSAEKSEGYKVFPAGSLFGIWTKPGMRALQRLANVPVWMRNSGFKDVGQQSDMVTFDIKWNKEGDKLRVQEDRRDKSLPAKLQAARAQVAENLDDIPF